MFYIADESADVLAKYRGGDSASVALKYIEEGWTSVVVCEPLITPELLREVFDILELPLIVRHSAPGQADMWQVREGLVLMHANSPGERALDFGNVYHVTDLLDPAIGWQNRRSVSLLVDTGETHLFEYTAPAETP